MSEAAVIKPEFDNLPVEIERAVPSDAEAIMAIKHDAWLDRYVNEELGVTAEDIYDKLGDMSVAINNWQNGIAGEKEDGDRITYVARLDGKVVGFTAPCIENGRRLIDLLYVAPDAQDTGIGGKLIRKAIEWHGCSQDIYLDAVSYNDDAIGFYEHFGFEKTGVETAEEFDAQLGIKRLAKSEMVLRANT